jgi:hypothetical protein
MSQTQLATAIFFFVVAFAICISIYFSIKEKNEVKSGGKDKNSPSEKTDSLT